MNPRIALPKTKPEDDHESLRKMQEDLLQWAEELFGQRETSWTLLPPIFGDRNPYIFFPDLQNISSIKEIEPIKLVQIKLGCRALDNWNRVLFQLAHEVIHLLNPLHPDHGKANYLEEGVACAFSSYVQRRCSITGSDFVRDNLPAYKYAHSLIKRLPAGNIAAAKRIRREMTPGTSFSSISKEDLLRIFRNINPKHADALTSKFDRDKADFPDIGLITQMP